MAAQRTVQCKVPDAVNRVINAAVASASRAKKPASLVNFKYDSNDEGWVVYFKGTRSKKLKIANLSMLYFEGDWFWLEPNQNTGAQMSQSQAEREAASMYAD